MKRVLKLTAVILVISVLLCSCTKKADDGTIKVGISKVITHAALDAVENGIKDYLNESGLKVAFDLQNANGEASTAASIAQAFKSEKCDYVVGIGTPTAQALANVFDATPVLYSAVTNPSDSGLTAANLCGTSDLTPVETNIKMWVKATGAKNLGNIYTSSEANSIYLNRLFEKVCKEIGVNPISVAVTNTSEVKQAAQALVPRVDAIYLDTDNNVISTVSSIAEVCTQNNIPLMLADTTQCGNIDFTISMGFDYYNLGRKTGEIIESLNSGKKPSEIGVVFMDQVKDFDIWVNLDNARKLGVTVPQELLDSASVIIENGVKR